MVISAVHCTRRFGFWWLGRFVFVSFMFHDKYQSYKYEKLSREIWYCKMSKCALEGSMARAWQIFCPITWNASEDRGGPSRKAGEFSSFPVFDYVFVKNPYFQVIFVWSGIIVCVFAKPVVLGPLGRVSGAVLSLISRSAALHHCLAKTLSQRPLCSNPPLCLSFSSLLFFSHTLVFLGFVAFLGHICILRLSISLELTF